MRKSRHLLAFLAVAMMLAAVVRAESDRESARGPNDARVILFVIDGPRHTEAFDDPDHRYVSRMWNELRPQGALIPEFRNDGQTLTNPGHASIVTGTWQTIANNGSERPTEPTLFEHYRQTYGVPKKETYVVSGKRKLNACSYSTHEDFGRRYGATERVGLADDRAVFDELVAIMKGDKPRLVMACFPAVDRAGHSGDWDAYVSAIGVVDSLLVELWDFVQHDPFYKDKTYVFVSNDHGRHDDKSGGFSNHGCGCEGCRRGMFLALGPTIKANYQTSKVYTQRDIFYTVASILELTVEKSDGVVIEEIFEGSR